MKTLPFSAKQLWPVAMSGEEKEKRGGGGNQTGAVSGCKDLGNDVLQSLQ